MNFFIFWARFSRPFGKTEFKIRLATMNLLANTPILKSVRARITTKSPGRRRSLEISAWRLLCFPVWHLLSFTPLTQSQYLQFWEGDLHREEHSSGQVKSLSGMHSNAPYRANYSFESSLAQWLGLSLPHMVSIKEQREGGKEHETDCGVASCRGREAGRAAD